MAGGYVTVRERNGKKTYRATIDLGPDPVTGKRRQRRKDFARERDAKKHITTVLALHAQGRAVDVNNQTVAQMMNYWLETYAKMQRAKTCEDYERTIRVHILPALGHLKVQKLTARELQQFYADMAAAGKGTRTIQLCHLRLHQALKQALKQGAVSRNVADDADPPKSSKKELVTWNVAEAKQFLDKAETMSTYGPIWHISLATGLRRGELLGLRWQDIDWENSQLRVRQSVGLVGGKTKAGETKSENAIRDVLVGDETMQRLDGHHTQQLAIRAHLGQAWHDHDLVFAAANGNPVNPNNLLRQYVRIIEAAGVKRIKIHGQRHTHATWALEEGADLKAVSKRLGHGKSSVTLDFYQHVTKRLDQEVVDKLSRKMREEDGE